MKSHNVVVITALLFSQYEKWILTRKDCRTIKMPGIKNDWKDNNFKI